MKIMTALIGLVLLGVIVGDASGANGAPYPISLTNWVDHEWQRTLLNYDLNLPQGQFFEGKAVLLDDTAAPVPSQVVVLENYKDRSIKRCRLSFYAELGKNGQLVYALTPTEKPATTSPQVTATRKGNELELTTASAGVRVPAPGGQNFKEPVEAGQVPAPILAFRLADGTWAGRGWLESESKISGYSQTVVADGPLYKEYAYEVRFAPQGYYRVRIRLEAEQAFVRVFEEYDVGRATAGKDFFVLALNEGWKPDSAIWNSWVKPEGATERQSAGSRLDDMRLCSEPLAFTVDREQQQFYPWREYSTKANYYGLFSEAAPAGAPFVGLISQHVGAWRLPDSSLSAFIWTASGQVLAKMRLSINAQGTPMNPFSTAQIDPDLPQTLGRRVWLLALGPRPAAEAETKLDVSRLDRYRGYDGFINLDDYKDWVLAWPTKTLSRPRVYTTPEGVARLKASLDRCPGRDAIKDFYLITGDANTAEADAARLLNQMDGRFRTAIVGYNPVFRQIQSDEALLFYADSCLSCASLPAELAAKIRAKSAAIWYMTKHPDYYPRGAGVHLGNPNMTFNRSMGIPMWATLLQDHPEAKAVLDDMAVFTKWLSGYNITPAGGVFRDGTHYSTYGPSLFMTKAAIALRNAGYDLDQWLPLKELGSYFVGIESPPVLPRAKNLPKALQELKARHLPAFGNGNDVYASQTELQLAALTAKSDPTYASAMMGAFGEAASYLGTGDSASDPLNWFYWDPAITPQKPVRTDQTFAGFGGVLRAHSEDPEETYIALRQGYVQSHWASDQGSDQGTFVLYARGASLCPGTGWSYSRVPDGFNHDSRLSFGQPTVASPFGFVDSNIEDYGFVPSVGYLLGRQGFQKKWDKSGAFTGDFSWSRQVLMIRSERVNGPNYAIVRDTTQGPAPKSWWFQWIQAKSENVKPIPGGVHIEATQGVKLDVTFVEPAQAQVTVKGTQVSGYAEDYTQLSVSQDGTQPYLAVFFPFKEGEPTPTVERLAEGVAKIVTSESTDYVFCNADKPVVFKNDDIDIHAFAGAIRVFKDRVLLVNASGQAGSVGYKGVVAEGVGPFEHKTSVSPGQPGVVKTGRQIASVEAPRIEGKKVELEGSGSAADAADAVSEGLRGYLIAGAGRQAFIATAGTGRIGYKDFWIKGEAPFAAVHESASEQPEKGGSVTVQTEGRRRVIQMPIPADLVPSNLLPPYDTLSAEFKKEWINWPWAVDVQIDGVSRQGGWYDGRMTCGVPEGRHEMVFRPYTNPSVWRENAYTRLLPVPEKKRD